MVYKVHNIHESRPGNWKAHWENHTGLKFGQCHKIGCYHKAEDGAHVQLDDPNDDTWYIVPLCHECNCQFGAHFFVTGPLVSVDGIKIRW